MTGCAGPSSFELLSKVLDLSAHPLLDVRSPAEFHAGHVPGAISFPLFSDSERARVGTCYKQEGPTKAFELGLQLIGPQLSEMVQRARYLADGGRVTVMCWRGGLRSSSLTWLLQTASIQAETFQGGYKAFRGLMRAQFERSWQLQVLGGLTGCGKTELLYALRDAGEQILDLEATAHHRGSAFGQLNQPPAPSQEHFENRLGWALLHLDATRPIWVEDESRMLGKCKIPDPFFQQMSQAPLSIIQRPEQERVERLMGVYALAGPSALSSCTWRLHKKLGRETTHQVIQSIQQGDLESAIRLLLPYYEKGYLFSLRKRSGSIQQLATEELGSEELVAHLLRLSTPLVEQ